MLLLFISFIILIYVIYSIRQTIREIDAHFEHLNDGITL